MLVTSVCVFTSLHQNSSTDRTCYLSNVREMQEVRAASLEFHCFLTPIMRPEERRTMSGTEFPYKKRRKCSNWSHTKGQLCDHKEERQSRQIWGHFWDVCGNNDKTGGETHPKVQTEAIWGRFLSSKSLHSWRFPTLMSSICSIRWQLLSLGTTLAHIRWLWHD